MKSNAETRYKHVIVDEGQDLSANGLRLLRSIAGEEHPNDIFIVGDAHQRIYKNKAALSKCGINVRGRSSILRINYRTTGEIRKAAFALLNGISFDDLDDDFDTGDRCQSLTHGKPPKVLSFSNANEELDAVLKEIKALISGGVLAKNICVVARTRRLLEDYVAQFTANGLRCYEIKGNKADDRGLDGIRVATMHRVKGLEFQYIFVVAANKRIIPLASAIDHTDSVSELETMTAEKCLLYVALTRAQKGAYISGYGQMSEFIKT
jgi:superfamily I DNA/RNA helicase